MKITIDLDYIPYWRRGYRFQYEPSQQQYILLYPEGMIKLNESAAAISQLIDGKNNIKIIIQKLKEQFGEIDAIENDVIDYMLVAQKEQWIDFSHDH